MKVELLTSAGRWINSRDAIAATPDAAWQAGVDLSRSAAVDQIVRHQRDASDEIGWSVEED